MPSYRSFLLILLPGVLLLASCDEQMPFGPENSLWAPAHPVTFMTRIEGTDLGTLGGQASYALAISKWGIVVGYSNTASGDVHAFRWTAIEGMVDLGTLPGDVASGAVSILTTGRILGWSRSAEGIHTPVSWGAGGRIQRLDIPPPGGSAAGLLPTDFNEREQIIGSSITLDGMERGWYWSQHSGTVDLRVEIPSCLENSPSAINLHGLVAGGFCAPAIGWLHAFIWQQGRGFTDPGIVGDDIANTSLVALSLNDPGQVVGWISTLSLNAAYVWSATDGFTLLPSPGALAYATGINNRGVAVGAAAGGLPNEPIQAVAWPSVNTIVKLGGASSYASVATAVNDRGQAAGWISFDNAGTNHAMVWQIQPSGAQPVAESHSVAGASMASGAPQPRGDSPEACLSDRDAISSRGGLIRCVLQTM